MNINEAMMAEYKHEAANTRKLLERVPADKFDFKPHEKSMSMGRLATHIAEIPDWLTVAMTTNEMDLSKRDFKPTVAVSNEHLLEIFDKHLAQAMKSLEEATNEAFMENWSLRNDEHVYFTMPKIAVLRTLVFSHIIHHRGQLSVYLRLNNIPVPGVYGPSADEQ